MNYFNNIPTTLLEMERLSHQPWKNRGAFSPKEVGNGTEAHKDCVKQQSLPGRTVKEKTASEEDKLNSGAQLRKSTAEWITTSDHQPGESEPEDQEMKRLKD